jgi:hypothetical protein
VGGTIGFVVALILLAMTVGELKRARISLRGAQARGRVVWAESSRADRYGDTVEKVVDVQFTTASGVRIKFTEKVGLDRVDAQQEVTVHYDPAHPMLSATIYPPRAAFGRVIGYGAVAALLIGAFVVQLILR